MFLLSNGKLLLKSSQWRFVKQSEPTTESPTVSPDIFKQKNLEAYRMLKIAAEQSIDGIALADMGGIIRFCNRSWAKMHGYDVNELLGRHLSMFHNPEQMVKDVIPFNRLVEENGAHHGEVGHIRKDGTVFLTWMAVTLLKDKKGRPIGLVGTTHDITERKKAERQINLINERQKFLLSSTTAVIYTSRAGGDYGTTFISENVIKISGYGPQKFTEESDFWIKHLHPQDRRRILEDLPILFKRGYHIYEYRFLHKNGSYIWMRDEMQLARDKEGRPQEIIGYWIDISEQRKAQEKIKTLNVELIKSNKRLKKLVLRDSHTGLYNHRYLQEAIESEFDRAKRHKRALSVIMMDIDYFKSINDIYGHQFGDLVLKQLARELKRNARRYDSVIRFGGEEFLVIAPNTDKPTAIILAQRLLDYNNLCTFGNRKHSIKLKLTFSIASYPEDKLLHGVGLINLADQILNKAKEDGGDRVYSSSDVDKIRHIAPDKTKKRDNINSLEKKIAKLTKRANQGLIEAVFAFAKTIKLKDHYTGEHVENTVYFAAETARAFGLGKEEVEYVRQASMVHDLGKIGISERILLKKTSLNKHEFTEIKKHTQIGADILRPIHFLSNIIPLILYHHERWDGAGYPSGLKEEEIPIGARIVAIADVFQALISDRPYRQAHSKDKAIEIIKSGSASQFDPRVVDTFLKVI